MIRVIKRTIRNLHTVRSRQLEVLTGNPEAAVDMGLVSYLRERVRLKAQIAELELMIQEGTDGEELAATPLPVDPADPVVGDTWTTENGRPLVISFVGSDSIGVTEPDGEERDVKRRIFTRDHTREAG